MTTLRLRADGSVLPVNHPDEEHQSTQVQSLHPQRRLWRTQQPMGIRMAIVRPLRQESAPLLPSLGGRLRRVLRQDPTTVRLLVRTRC
jgi:hypothetical protein